MDVAALIISILAFGLSVLQFLRDTSRQKKESTLNAYNALQYDAFEKLNKHEDLTRIDYDSPEWEEITICLAQIENFSVGINTNIYSLEILNRVGGSFFIQKHRELSPIIEEKRERDTSRGKHYDEYEKTVALLCKYRESRRGKIQIRLKRMIGLY